MAIEDDRDFEGEMPSPQEPTRLQWFINMAGAVTSVGMVLGLGVWGYDLAVRDVTGIPVVRALEGPMRIAPQEPGGEIVAHTGLSVNEIAAEGAAAALPEQMVLAPRPIELSDEDQPVSLAAATPSQPELETRASLPVVDAITDTMALADTGLPPLAPGVLTETLLPARATDEAVSTAALNDGLGQAEEDSIQSSVNDALAEALAGEAMLASVDEPAPQGAVVRSPRPERRPEGDASAEIAIDVAVPAGEAVAMTGEVDVASLTPGTRMVQLGAFDDEAGARTEWARLQARFGDLIASKALVLQDAESGGRRFVRLRALGFEDEADARRFCSALLAEKATCIPVSHRP